MKEEADGCVGEFRVSTEKCREEHEVVVVNPDCETG